MEGLRRAARLSVAPHPPSHPFVFVEPRAVHFVSSCPRTRRHGKVRAEPFGELVGPNGSRWCSCVGDVPALTWWHELLSDAERVADRTAHLTRLSAGGATAGTTIRRRRLLADVERLARRAEILTPDPGDAGAAQRLWGQLRESIEAIPFVAAADERSTAIRASAAVVLGVPDELDGDRLGIAVFEHWRSLVADGTPLDRADRSAHDMARRRLHLHPDITYDTAVQWCRDWRGMLDACEESWLPFGQHAVLALDPDDDPAGGLGLDAGAALGAARPVSDRIWVAPAVCAAALCSPVGHHPAAFCDLGELTPAELDQIEGGELPAALEVAAALAGTEWAGVDLLEMGRAALAAR